MPIYEYQCNACGHHFDVMQKMSDAPETVCPKCYKKNIVRLVSAAGFQLKGTGWYATDFKNKPTETKPAEAKKTTEVKPANTTKDTASQEKM